MTDGKPSSTNIIILYDNIFNTIRFMMDENDPETYDVWLCQDTETKSHFVLATQFNTRIDEAGIKPIKMLTGWAPNQSNPGNLFVHLLEKIKDYFGLDSILAPTENVDGSPGFTDPPWYIK